jgi:hypothetical protein
VVVILAASGGVSFWHFHEGGASETSVTIAPSPVSHPDIFSDPQQPVVDSSRSLAPDARRVLTVIALQMSLDEFRQANGHYPDSLDELFPDYAALNEQGQVMTSVPQDPETGAYQYTRQGDSYQLSIQTSKGEYAVSGSGGGS